MTSMNRREALKQAGAVAAAAVAAPRGSGVRDLAGARFRPDARGCSRQHAALLPGLPVGPRQDHRRGDQRGARRLGPAAPAAARRAAVAHLVAAGGAGTGQDAHRHCPRPARLWRQQQAARRREPRQLLEAGDGARPGRGDEALRLRQVPGRRPRSRRPRRPSPGARPCRQGHPAGGARHRADLLPLHARHRRLHPGLLPLVQQRARRSRAGRAAEGAVRGAAGARDHRRADRIPAASTATPPTSTACARTIAPRPPSI